MTEFLFKEESYKIIGVCMEVHRVLGMGFKEIIYKDALQIEFESNQMPFEREKRFTVEYKGIQLRNKFNADFVLYNSIIIEVKSASFIVNGFVDQTINYLKASGIKLGIIVNFGERSLTYKRIVFWIRVIRSNSRHKAISNMTIEEAQQQVDFWIKTVGVRYFNELTNLGILMEEVGELSRLIVRTYGEQSFKESDKGKAIADEMADVLWVLICLANQTGVNLTEALQKNFEKKNIRDATRHKDNEKLK